MAGDRYWFTDYQGEWKPEKGQYNTLFAEQVRLLRSWFRLMKVTTGRETGTDHWLDYRVVDLDDESRTRKVKVNASGLIWNQYSSYHSMTTPKFVLSLEVKGKPKLGFFRNKITILQKDIEILFPSDF